ncbi:FUSC family protein [Neisseria perflava]|uniref:FUSC family protein n=1 Tax=Neisseria perflava TaxID=33053 RepID=UPI0020A0551A|nr:FUSC family protein [Neisseria perflava]MCP1659253.1 putative membrane protein YccC [Neisseria perflava]MCP1773153.1 putative membrane protein YccC [Neisseria perflava]
MKTSERVHFAERWLNSYERYRHRRLIHAVRLGLAVLLATLIARLFHLQHGEWIGMTVFVVLGMLQFQGAIYSKAVERMLGTVIGLGIGLAVLWLNQQYFHNGILFYLTVGTTSALAGWWAVGKNGYIHMLAGLTMCMLLANTGDEWLHSSLMRAFNVLLGALIAICAAKLLPLRSTLMWRFMLADNLTECGRLMAEIGSGKRMTREQYEQNAAKMKKINSRLVQSRSHLAATSGESHISRAAMEAMQLAHRKIVNSTELLLNTAAKLPNTELSEDEKKLLERHFTRLQRELRLTVRLIKGHYARRIRIDTRLNPELGKMAAHLPFEWQGFVWLGTNTRSEVAALVILLQRTRRKWLDAHERQRLREHLRGNKADAREEEPRAEAV